MSRRSRFYIIFFLVLCTTGAASALPLDLEASEAPGGIGLLDGLWGKFLDWVDRMEGLGDGLTLREMEGCHLDPNGVCAS